MQSLSLRPLPTETIRAARSLLNSENLYLAIGDQLDLLLGDLDLEDMDRFGENPADTLATLAMVTAFQFAEDLTDRQARKATRTRLDWKYALHLSVDYPGIDESALVEYRQQLRLNAAGQLVFQGVLTRLAETGLLGNGDKRRAEVIDVLTAVDTLSGVEKVGETMALALEALAAERPEWLRMISLPHWVVRYDQKVAISHLSRSLEDQTALLQAMEDDVSYLLQAIEEADAPEIALLLETQALRRVWHQQFGPHKGRPT